MLGIACQCIYECDLVCIRCCFCVLYNKGQILIQVNKVSIMFVISYIIKKQFYDHHALCCYFLLRALFICRIYCNCFLFAFVYVCLKSLANRQEKCI